MTEQKSLLSSTGTLSWSGEEWCSLTLYRRRNKREGFGDHIPSFVTQASKKNEVVTEERETFKGALDFWFCLSKYRKSVNENDPFRRKKMIFRRQ